MLAFSHLLRAWFSIDFRFGTCASFRPERATDVLPSYSSFFIFVLRVLVVFETPRTLHGLFILRGTFNSRMMASTGPDGFAPAVGADGGENVGQKLEHTLSNNQGMEEVTKAEKDGDNSNGEAAGWSLLPDVQRMAANDTKVD